MNVSTGHFVQEPAGAPCDEGQNTWPDESHLTLAMFTVDAVFLAKALVERCGERIEIRGLGPRIELHEKGVA